MDVVDKKSHIVGSGTYDIYWKRDYEHSPELKAEGVQVGDTLVVIDWVSGEVIEAGGGSPLMLIGVLAVTAVLLAVGGASQSEKV